jgi:hypothetical protein
MANKQTKKNTPVEDTEVNVTHETVVLERPQVQRIEKPQPKKDMWEFKDRFYYLNNGLSPLTYRISSRNLFFFDPEKGYEREITYARNQNTPFIEDFKGSVQLGHIVFRHGVLMVPKAQQSLQKFLSIYNPLKGKLYSERDEEKIPDYQVVTIETELRAMNAAVGMDIDMAEAIMRVNVGSSVSEMSSKELKRDLLVFAKANPVLFLDLASDDNIALRNLGIKATELGILKLSIDQRTFSWGETDRKLFTVPFDEHPYSALAAWFKTDEGMQVFTSVEKRLK